MIVTRKQTACVNILLPDIQIYKICQLPVSRMIDKFYLQTFAH